LFPISLFKFVIWTKDKLKYESEVNTNLQTLVVLKDDAQGHNLKTKNAQKLQQHKKKIFWFHNIYKCGFKHVNRNGNWWKFLCINAKSCRLMEGPGNSYKFMELKKLIGKIQ
jgi:uncharacterized ferritin-like protein (DUF455 family)